jgi:hypothetical protein
MDLIGDVVLIRRVAADRPKSGSGSSSKSNSSQGGTSQQKKEAGRKGGEATANKS